MDRSRNGRPVLVVVERNDAWEPPAFQEPTRWERFKEQAPIATFVFAVMAVVFGIPALWTAGAVALILWAPSVLSEQGLVLLVFGVVFGVQLMALAWSGCIAWLGEKMDVEP